MIDPVLTSQFERKQINVRIVKWIRDRVDYSHERRNRPYTFYKDVSFFDHQLPHIVDRDVVDEDMKYDLEDSRSINWFPRAVELFPVCVSKDGNCLLHAASVAVWGVEDSQNTLRDLMLMTVKNNHNFKKRWWSQLMRNLQSLEINQPEVLNREWDDVIRSISDLGSSSLSIAVPHRFLEGIHIYILANILRRPIIIVTNGPARSLSGFELQENHISGLYLPLEWAPIECCKTPIILGYSFSHFCPLISKSHPYSKTPSQGKKKPFLFPLVNSDLSFLLVRYLKEEEDHKAWDLVQSYLLVKEVDIVENVDSVTKAPFAQMHLKSWRPEQKALFENAKSVSEKRLGESEFLRASRGQSHITQGTSQHPFYDIERNSQTEVVLMRPRKGFKEPQINKDILGMYMQERAMKTPNKCINEGCGKQAATYLDQFCPDCFRILQAAEMSIAAAPLNEDHYLQNLRESSTTTGERNLNKQLSETILNEDLVVVPTAPLMSVEQQSHNEPLLSMMNDRCVNNCGYRCSFQTHPYCHECYQIELQRIRKNPDQSNIVAAASDILVAEHKSEDNSKSLETATSLSDHRGYDMNHAGSHPSQSLILSSNWVSALVNSSERPHQLENDHIKRNHLSKETYKNLQHELEILANQNYEKFENIFGSEISDENQQKIVKNSNEDLQLKTHDHGTAGETDTTKEGYVRQSSEESIHGFPEIDMKNTSQDIEVSAEPSCNIKCASPFCQTFISQQDKLCKKCQDILKRDSEKNPEYARNNEQVTVSQAVKDQLKKEKKQHVDYIKLAQDFQQINRVSTLTENEPIHKKQKKRFRASKGEPCVVLACPNYGDPQMDNKCSSCYFKSNPLAKPKGKLEILTKGEKTSVSPKRAVTEQVLYKNGAQVNASQQRKEHSRNPQQFYKGNPVYSQQVSNTRQTEEQISKTSAHVPTRRFPVNSNPHQTYASESSMLSLESSNLGQSDPRSLMVTSKTGHNTYESVHLPPDSSYSFKQKADESFERTFQGIERTWKSMSKKCVSDQCMNYGNKDNEGYCNACYRVIVRQRSHENVAQIGVDVPDTAAQDCA